MSILIEGMEMPLSCGYCALKKFKYGIGDDCLFGAKETEYQKRPIDCPLIEVPEPHGRLIDADALIEAMARMVPWAIADPTANAFLDGLSAAYEAIQTAPTIILAEKE